MNYQEEVKKFFGEENQLSYAATMFYSALFEYAARIEREECADIAEYAKLSAARIGLMHEEDSASRDRMFARSRESDGIAEEIRNKA